MQRLFTLLLLTFAAIPNARALPLTAAPEPGVLCRQAISAAARAHGVPPGLMAAIGRVESGRPNPATGALHPWPWTIDAEGQGSVFASKAEAVAAVRALQSSGMRSIDVGCMQVNLMHHPDAFASLEQALDPVANADYAARLLVELHGQAGTWPTAAALYHSATPEIAAPYAAKVMAAWPEEERAITPSFPTAAVRAPAGLFSPGQLPLPMRRPAAARILPLPSSSATPGRSLDAYRAAPILPGWRRAGG